MTKEEVDYLFDLIQQSDVYISFDTAEKIIIHHQPLGNDLHLYGYTFAVDEFSGKEVNQERWIRFGKINLEKDMFFKLIPNELRGRQPLPRNYPLP